MRSVIIVYSKTFDDGENCVNGGFSGKVFLDCDTVGYVCDSFEDALQKAIELKMEISEVVYCYKSDNEQLFKKLTINCPVV